MCGSNEHSKAKVTVVRQVVSELQRCKKGWLVCVEHLFFLFFLFSLPSLEKAQYLTAVN